MVRKTRSLNSKIIWKSSNSIFRKQILKKPKTNFISHVFLWIPFGWVNLKFDGRYCNCKQFPIAQYRFHFFLFKFDNVLFVQLELLFVFIKRIYAHVHLFLFQNIWRAHILHMRWLVWQTIYIYWYIFF